VSGEKFGKADMEADGGTIISGASQEAEDYSKLAVERCIAGNYQEAITLYQQAIVLSKTNVIKARVSTELGWLYYEMGELGEGEAKARNALSLLSQESETGDVLACRGESESLLAHCLWDANNDAGSEAAGRAIECLDQAIDKTEFTEKQQAYLDAAIVHYLVGHTRQAIIFCEKCLQCELDEWQRISCLTVQAGALRIDGKFKEAEEVIRETLERARSYKTILPNLYIELGLTQTATNRLADAQLTFQQALAALDGDPYKERKGHLYGEVCKNLGALCFEMGKYEEAVVQLKECLRYFAQDDYNYWNALLWLGHSYKSTESDDKARDLFKDLLASPHATGNDKGSAQKGLGELYYKSAEYEKAAERFEAALLYEAEDDPNRSNTLLWLGNCYEASSALDKALDCYEGILCSAHALESDKVSARECVLRLPPRPKKSLH